MITSPKTSAMPTVPSAAGVLGLGDDRAAAGEDEGEGADRLGGGAAGEVGTFVHACRSGRLTPLAGTGFAGAEKTSRTESRAPGTRLK